MVLKNLLAGMVLLRCIALSPASAAESGDIAVGQQLFMADGCYECHGTRGAGGGNAGPALRGALSLDAWKKQLRNPAARMPVYTQSVLSDAQAAQMYAYVKSLPARKPAASIPLLSDTN